MIEGLMFLFALAMIGAVLLWAIINEPLGLDDGTKGWFAMRSKQPRPQGVEQPPADSDNRPTQRGRPVQPGLTRRRPH